MKKILVVNTAERSFDIGELCARLSPSRDTKQWERQVSFEGNLKPMFLARRQLPWYHAKHYG